MIRNFTIQKCFTAFIVIALSLVNASAQVTFYNNGAVLQNIGGTSQGDCAADMDGDGLDDVVRVMSNGIYIDYQHEDGIWTNAFFPMAIENVPSWSICAADIDGNGFCDLLLGAGNAVSFVYANDSGTDYTEDAHPEYIFTQRSTFADIDNDGNLDAFANHDVDQCHPYRNVDGILELDFSLIQTLDVGGNYAAIWVDYDNDWDSDLYITKCRGGAPWGDLQRVNLLYRNNGDGTYTEAAAEANMNDGNQSWTTVFEDFDNDGDFDAFTCNHPSGDVPGGAANKFMRNNGDGTFTDIIGTTGINATDLGAWNCDAGDFDNNGFVDIFSEMGTVMYWNNGDGTFTGGPGVGFNSGGIGDFNNDGFLDVIAGNNLWINDTNANNYVIFDLEGIESNKSAVGARIEIYGDWGVQIREVRSGESFDPASSLTAHFGIGSSTSIDQVIIKWPSGMLTVIDNPEINTTHQVLEAGCMAAPIVITASGSTSLCPGQTVTLSAPAGMDSYLWINGDNTQVVQIDEPGNYYAIGFDEGGCAAVSNSILVDVLIEDAPVLTLSGEETFCQGSTVILSSTEADTYEWSNGQTGQSIVVEESGEYAVVVTGECPGVFYYSAPITLNMLPSAPPVAESVTIGEPGTAVLTATGNNLNWYASANGTEVIGTGNSLTTEFFDSAISYWVESVNIYGGEEMTGGKPDNAGNGGLPSTGGKLIFDAFEPFTLEQVTAYVPTTGTAGQRTVQLFDAGNTLINSIVVDCQIGENVIDLNFDIPVGNGYQIGCSENNLFRNQDDLAYPFAIGDAGQITSSTFGDGYYYYYYNWQIKKEETVCISDRVEVQASVVSLDEINNPLGIELYPNPAQDNLTIQAAELNGGSVQMKITDATGRTVMNQQLNVMAKSNANVDISSLAPGVYHITLSQGDLNSSLDFVKE